MEPIESHWSPHDPTTEVFTAVAQTTETINSEDHRFSIKESIASSMSLELPWELLDSSLIVYGSSADSLASSLASCMVLNRMNQMEDHMHWRQKKEDK